MKHLTLAVLGFSLLSLGTVHAEGFVRFEGIDGPVTADGYQDWCTFTSVVQEIKPSETRSGITTRQTPEFQQLVLVKPVDRASPVLARRALKASIIPKVEIEWLVNAGEVLLPYYGYELRNVQIIEYASKGLEDAAKPIREQLSLDFEEITVTYWEYDSDGKLKGTVEYSWSTEKPASMQ